MKRSLPLLVILLLSAFLLQAQAPSGMSFYKGDTLKGFDMQAAYNAAVKSHMEGKELRTYLRNKEREFTEQKYHLPSAVGRTMPVNPVPTAGCNNLDFETGTFAGWTGNTGYNNNSTTALTFGAAGLTNLGNNSPETSCSAQTLVNGGVDPYGGFPMVGVGTWSCRLGGENYNLGSLYSACNSGDPITGGSGGEVLQQTFTVTPANALFTYNYAVVLLAAAHTNLEVPYFRAEVLDASNNPIPCLQYYIASDSTGPPVGFSISPTTSFTGSGGPVYYQSWVASSLNLTAYMGTAITIRFTAGGCTVGGHFGYAYIDCQCGPVQVLASSPEVCLGGTINLTAPPIGPGGGTYAWTKVPAGAGITTNTTLPTVTINQPGTYQVSVNQNGCVYTVDTTLAFFPLPTVTLTHTDATCSPGNDGTATATVTGGNTPYTYSWSPAPGAGGTTATPTAMAAGTYTVTVTTTNGCTTTGTVTIAQPVNTPAITITNTPPSCTPGHDGTATATVTAGVTPYTYSWTGGPIGGGQGTSAITGLDNGTYTLTVTGPPGSCSSSATTTLSGAPAAPTVTATATAATCNPGNDGTATATATGGTLPYTYAWTGGAITGGQGTANATGLAAGTYTCTVTSPSGCSSFATATVTSPGGPSSTSVATPVACFGGNNGTATATPTGGTAPLTYSWTTANGAIGGGATTVNATGLTAGTYTFTVQDGSGCGTTNTVTVTQPTLLTVTASGVAATCNGKCNGQVICLPAGGTATYTYSWSGSGCTSASCNNICAGTYTSTITDAHGCIATSTAVVPQPTPLVMTMTPKAADCGKPDGKDSVFVSGGTPGYTYSWTPAPGAGSTTTSYSLLVPGTYTVYIKDNNGCPDSMTNVVPNKPGVVLSPVSTTRDTCFGSSNGTATVAAAGGFPAYTYSWSTAPSQTTVTATGLAAGNYTCTVTDSAHCVSTVIIPISQPPPVTLAPGPPATICIGACTTLSAVGAGGTPGYTYVWTQGATVLASTTVCPQVTTTYTASVMDSHGCIAPPVNITIIVNPPLEVVASGANTICPGGSTVLNAVGSGGNGGPYTYNWMPPTGLSSTTVANPTASPTVTTTYTVIVNDNCGTPTDSDYVTVTLYPLPVVNFTSHDTVQCAPSCATFVGVSAPACASATWTFGDGTSATGCNTASHCYNVAGNYSVTYNVIDINGCPGTHTITNFINALPVPVAAFSASPQPTTILDPQIFFTDQSTGAITSWSWNFGDLTGATSILQNPNFTYPDTGCYPVTLIVVGTDGCPATIEHPVCIQPYFTFYAPNTFTPNGDGKNDTWSPNGIGIDPANYHLMMFDRWGNLMWETHTWLEGWDGRANGGANIAQIDTYVWKVDLKDVFHEKHQYIGHCNIIK